ASVVTIDPDVTFRELGGEIVILNLGTGVYFGLDEVGARIWRLIEDHGSLEAVLAVLRSEYEACPAVLEHHLLELVVHLRAKRRARGDTKPAGRPPGTCAPRPCDAFARRTGPPRPGTGALAPRERGPATSRTAAYAAYARRCRCRAIGPSLGRRRSWSPGDAHGMACGGRRPLPAAAPPLPCGGAPRFFAPPSTRRARRPGHRGVDRRRAGAGACLGRARRARGR